MQNSFTTQPLIRILNKWKIKLILFIIIATAVGSLATLFVPKQYLSSSTVIPANPKLADKNFIYGTNVMELNGNYGTEEDLDRLLTNLRLSSNFSKMVDSFKLIEHYKIKNNSKAKANAIEELVENSSIVKTDNGAIKITVWDTDNNYAANIANALVGHTANNNNLQNQQANNEYLSTLEESIKKQESTIANLDTIKNNTIKEAQRKVQEEAYLNNATAIEQLKLTMQTNTSSIKILEKAYPSLKADKPKLRFWLVASLLASSIFGVLAILLYESIKRK
jgi:capsular polysaccharide biosynthesis protein